MEGYRASQDASQSYHIWVDLVSEAGDVHHIRPVIRFHEYSCSMGTGDMEGSWTTAIGALDAGSRDLLNPVSAEHAFLEG